MLAYGTRSSAIAPAGLEHNAYQLITADGTRRIKVSTPLDAYNPGKSGD